MAKELFLTELELCTLQRNVAMRDALEQRKKAMFGEREDSLRALEDDLQNKIADRLGEQSRGCQIELDTGRLVPMGPRVPEQTKGPKVKRPKPPARKSAAPKKPKAKKKPAKAPLKGTVKRTA